MYKIIDVILPTVTHIFNASIMTGSYPSLWKMALVKPLPKSNTPSTVNQYRPISILPTLSKALEHIVHGQLTNYLDEHKLLDDYQSGFRHGHSTTTALLKVTEDIREAMDMDEVTALTLLDFSNAFSSVDIDLLLAKMKTLHLSDNTLSWMDSYLRDRQQCVSLDNQFSQWRCTKAGVPQGSVLGPLLFSIYINDVSKNLRYCRYHLYADDLQLYIHSRPNTINESIDKLNCDLATVSTWAANFGLALNPSKTQAIIIGHKRLVNSLNNSNLSVVTLNNTLIPYSSVVKNLGFFFDNNLSWNFQVKETIKKSVPPFTV